MARSRRLAGLVGFVGAGGLDTGGILLVFVVLQRAVTARQRE